LTAGEAVDWIGIGGAFNPLLQSSVGEPGAACRSVHGRVCTWNLQVGKRAGGRHTLVFSQTLRKPCCTLLFVCSKKLYESHEIGTHDMFHYDAATEGRERMINQNSTYKNRTSK
jgi:hypothetical protein